MLSDLLTKENAFIAILVGSGGYVVGASVFQFLRDRRARHWPTVTGAIVKSDVHGEWSNSDGDSSYMYSPDIEYAYEVDGVEYRGDRFRTYESSSSEESWARKAADRFPLDSEVEVFYNPSRPDVSMLRQAFTKLLGFFIFVIIGLGLIATGVWLFHSGVLYPSDEP